MVPQTDLPAAPRRAALARAGAACAAVACAAASAGVGCAAPRQPWRDTAPPTVFVEVLPRGASLSLDGAALGPGAREVPVPEPDRVYRFRAEAAGYAPEAREGAGRALAGARLGLALRPQGFGAARPLDLDEPTGLAAAAALLERAGRHGEAVEYAERSAELAPESPLPHRVLGDALLASGERGRAAQEYSAYLSVARDAPDRAEIEARVGELRGDVAIPVGR